MGNRQDTAHVSRGQRLVPEFLSSGLEEDMEGERGIQHMYVELQSLPSYVPDTTRDIVDDYTQVILSWEEDCQHTCVSSTLYPRNDRGQDSGKELGDTRLQRESDINNLCLSKEVCEKQMCCQDHSQTDTSYTNNARYISDQREENDDWSLATKGAQGPHVPGHSRVEAQCGQGGDTFIPRKRGVEKSLSDCKQKTRKLSRCRQLFSRDMLFEEDLISSKIFVPLSTSTDTDIGRQKCQHDCRTVPAQHCATDRHAVSEGSETASLRSAIHTVQPDRSAYSNSLYFQRSARRNSHSSPVSNAYRTSRTFPDSSKRKFSLKDEPGWIPNPLDSDSDDSDFEDSGVYSVSSGSSSLSTSPSYMAVSHRPHVHTPTHWAHRWRRQSEPVAVVPSFSISPSPPHSVPHLLGDTLGWGSDMTDTQTDSNRWLSKCHESFDEDSEAETDGDDLNEHLRWLAMTDSQLYEGVDYVSEDEVILDASEHFPDTHTTSSDQTDPQTFHVPDDTLPRVNNVEEEKAELDWLCEPEWNNLELELFWAVLRPHLENLLQPEDSELLPEACQMVCGLDAADPKMLDRCLLHVQWHIWRGSYRQAVADFRAIRRHFLCCTHSALMDSDTRNDVENLRILFQRKRPSRYRLWI